MAVCGTVGTLASARADDPAFAAVKGADDGYPSFDIRFNADGEPTQPVVNALAKITKGPALADELARLRASVDSVQIDDDPCFGTPRFVRSTSAFLTAADPAAAPAEVVAKFIRAYPALFEIDAAEIPNARKTRDFVTEHNGVAHLTFQQLIDGIDLFDAGIKANVARDGRLLNISSTMLPRPAKGFSVADAKLTDLEAIRAAAANVGVDVTADPTPAAEPQGANRKRTWNNSVDFRADRAIATQRVYFPLNRDEIHPAWYVTIPVKGIGHTYNIVVDAIDGTILHRVDELCMEVGTTNLRVFTVGPAPYPEPLFDSRRMVTVNPSDPGVSTASPFGWHDTNGVAGADLTDTRGNNVDAHLDANNDNYADLPRPNGGPSLVFNTWRDPAAQPATWGDASVVQSFYLANLYHDRLHTLGFTEAAGNFQTNNYGRGGVGSDAVQFDCQDGSGTNNANFATPVDGTPGRCQMYLWTSATPPRDSALDTSIVMHELTHGLSNRLTGGPANSSALNATQSGGMGEGWSDFVALCLDFMPGDNPNGTYPVGTYSANSSAGLRRRPYSTNTTTNPLNWDAYGSAGTTSYGIFRSTEVHNTGEIWCSALWDCRAGLFQTRGNAANELILKLAVDGMKLQPANPSFIQARDAVIQADLALTGGANRYTLWQAFAKRGLGASASTASSAADSVTMGFDVPEGTDVGELPASAGVLAGSSPITNISGSLSTGDVDMYRINICNFSAFSATTEGGAAFNTQLFLFDSNGLPVTFNDDTATGTQSRMTGQFLTANGDYYLAVSGADRDPVSSLGELWLDTPLTTERTAAGPGAGNVITGWTGTDATDGGTYTITLTGACGSTQGTFPAEPKPLTAYGVSSPGLATYGTPIGNTTFTVRVSAATLPASTSISVTLNASALGLGTLTLNSAGNGNYSRQVTLGTPPGGFHDLPYHVTDGQGRTYDGTLLLHVNDASGACCLPSGGCAFLTHQACAAQGGTYRGAGVPCDVNPCQSWTEVEPNNFRPFATDLSRSFAPAPGTMYHMGINGSLPNFTDNDYFNIGELQEGDVITISDNGAAGLGGSMSNALVQLLRANGGAPTVEVADDESGPGNDAMIWKFTISSTDTYIIRASRVSPTITGSYRLGILLENAGVAPLTGGAFANETEPNETVATANNASTSWRPVQYLSTVAGSITAGDTDYYSYQFTTGDVVTFNIAAAAPLDARLNLYNSGGIILRQEDGTSTGPGGDSPIHAYTVPSTGTYYISVFAASGTGGYFGVAYLSTNTRPLPLCFADFNQDGGVDGADVDAYFAAWELGQPDADVNQDGGVDGGDVGTFFAAWEAGVC
ncbi:MAG: M36 family metallopeptidase [Planctomycetes bacterium]|nr:M36 family metallopeptidase [Planctomycetota bacterium]